MPEIGGVPVFVPLLIVLVVLVGRALSGMVSRVFGVENEPIYPAEWESGTGCDE